MGKKTDDIINGWTNYFIGVDKADEETIQARAEICAGCPIASRSIHTALLPDMKYGKIKGMVCSKKKGGCGCPLSPAVRSKEYKCIKGKW